MRILRTALMAAAMVMIAAPAYADMATAQAAYADGDFTEALDLWRSEASAGNADAAWYVGNMYVDGLGIDEPDEEEAVIYYQLAIDQDHVEAQVSLGLLYAQGRGIDQDYHAAMDLLYAAALQDHAVAQVELANHFLYGVPGLVEQSPGHAFEWYGLASLQGVVLAQYRLAEMNFQGIGAPQNMEEGLMWLSIARDVALTQQEPYWSYRVFPLDAELIGTDGGVDNGAATLRAAVNILYDDYSRQMAPEAVERAETAARQWIGEHSGATD